MKFKKSLSVGILTALVLTTASSPIFGVSQKDIKADVALFNCTLEYGEHLNHAITYIKANDKDGEITRRHRAVLCDCGGKMHVKTVYDGEWYRSDESRKCTHYAYGHDYKWIKPAVTRYKCSKCELEFESYSTSRTEWRCGHN